MSRGILKNEQGGILKNEQIIIQVLKVQKKRKLKN